MTNQIENQKSQTRPESFWSASEQAELVKTLAIIINGQKAYGKDASVNDTFTYFRMKLEGKFTASQVMQAIDKYTDTHADLPTPADLTALINPEKPRISSAEFIHSKDQWAKEGYPSYSYYAMIVKQYERENQEERQEARPIEDKKILEIVQNSVKRIA